MRLLYKLDFYGIRNSKKDAKTRGTEAIRTQIQPLKPKREITKITNSQNTKRTYGQPSEQLFSKKVEDLLISRSAFVLFERSQKVVLDGQASDQIQSRFYLVSPKDRF